MNLNIGYQLIKAQKLAIGIFVVAFFILGVGLTLIQPLKYSSNLRLLVVQDASNVAGDPYAMARSNEYLSEVLSKVTYSTSFYSRVMSAGFNIDGNYFGNTNKKIAKNWNKTIEVKKINNTGIISISAFHTKAEQAEKIARAVGYVLITQNDNYHGLGNKVSLKLLDEPITSTWPLKPNLLLNAVLSLFLGLIFGLVYVYLIGDNKLEAAFASNYGEPKATFVDLSSEALAKGEDYGVPKQSEDWTKELAKIQSEPMPSEDLLESIVDLPAQAGNWQFIPEEPVNQKAANASSYGEPKSDDWLNDWK